MKNLTMCTNRVLSKKVVLGVAMAVCWSSSSLAYALDTLAAAAMLGITSDSLLVAGATAQEAEGILRRIAVAESERAALEALRSQADAAALEMAGFRAALASGSLDPGLADALQSADVRHAHLLEDAKTLRVTLLDLALQGTRAEVLIKLDAWRHTAEHGLPSELRCINLSVADLASVRRAFQAMRRAKRAGRTATGPDIVFLERLLMRTEVLQARQSLANQRVAIEQVFLSFLSTPASRP